MKLEKNSKIDSLFKIIMLFTIGCFIGCIFETILCYFQRGYFESRKGLIYGPFNPVYGIGIVVLVIFLERDTKRTVTFLKGTILGGVIEYLCSWFQEEFFKTTSWNYNNYFMNFNGRTSLYHMIWWGILAVLFMQLIYPIIKNIIYKVKFQYRTIVTYALVIFFTIDIIISASACIRQSERLRKIEATTYVDRLLDKYYPNERLNKIYPNLRDSKTKKKISKMK